MTRYRVKGHGALDLFIFLPLATPEVVLGAALLGLFLTMSVATGFATIVIAHVMFNLSYVVVTIRARLEGMDTHMEEAAMDLGANEWTTFRKVTLPLIAPGIAAAGLLAFAISFDDFVITNFNAGQTLTFPLYIWGAARQGVPPEVNVIATALLVIAVVFMALNLVIQRRLARRDAVVREEPEPALGVAPGSALAG
jgi:spermidine/putrescine transport system permease protein